MLKFVLDSLDGVGESTAALYKKDDDSGKFVLQVEGAVPKSKLDEFRTNNIRLTQELERFKGIDPKKFSELQEFHDNQKDKELWDDNKANELVQNRTKKMREDFEEKERGYKTQLSEKDRQLESLLIDSKVREVAGNEGVPSDAMQDVILRAKQVFRLEDGEAIPYERVNGQDQKVFGATGDRPLSIKEWVVGLKKTASHLFTPPSGGGADNSRGGGPQGGDPSKMTPMQKIQAGVSEQSN